jgi:hypothetical protein
MRTLFTGLLQRGLLAGAIICTVSISRGEEDAHSAAKQPIFSSEGANQHGASFYGGTAMRMEPGEFSAPIRRIREPELMPPKTSDERPG